MKNSIRVFELIPGESVSIRVRLKRWLSVSTFNGKPAICAEVGPDSEALEEFHTLYVRGTGVLMTGEEGDFLGTAFLSNAEVHVFAHISDSLSLLGKL